MKLTIELSLPAANPDTPDVHRVVTPQTGWKFTAQRPDGELY